MNVDTSILREWILRVPRRLPNPGFEDYTYREHESLYTIRQQHFNVLVDKFLVAAAFVSVGRACSEHAGLQPPAASVGKTSPVANAKSV